MTDLVARISNRVLVGPELCRNKEYTQTMVHFAEFLMVHAFLIRFCPVFLRECVLHLQHPPLFDVLHDDSCSSTLYSVASYFFGGKKEAVAILIKYLEKHIQDRRNMVEKPVRPKPSARGFHIDSVLLITQMLISEFLVRAAPPAELVDPTLLAMRMVNLNFGSIHTRYAQTLRQMEQSIHDLLTVRSSSPTPYMIWRSCLRNN
jgi:hypothetical protein